VLTEKGFSMTRIVVGLDGSSGSVAALEWALGHAELTRSEVTAVLAYSYDLAWIDGGMDYEPKWIEQKALAARRMLDELLAKIVPDTASVPVHPLVVEGPAAAVLVEIARDADLLIVGSRGRGAFTGLLLGSVSQRCVERSSVPVVVVPDPDRGSPGLET
jgi:nucleotide-binding universal stress UspA family protein